MEGERLQEGRIAAMLGIGRGAVREAIGQLVQEGLVVHVRNRGALVRTMTVADALDVYRAREAIEVGVARQLLRAGVAPKLEALQRAFAQLRLAACEQQPSQPSERLIRADVRFHQELVRLADSLRLTRVYDTLCVEMMMLLRHHPLHPAADYVASHRLLLEALARLDPRTPELLGEHLRLSARLIGAALAAPRAGLTARPQAPQAPAVARPGARCARA